jgi:predicted Zn-dependent protease
MPVEVQPALEIPPSAYDASRDQLNSAELLAAIDQQYPQETTRTVVIGLTGYDMYNPGFTWIYSFSMRHADRLGIVSTARMSYGCLGLVEASPEQQFERLRKMVGKNLGLLYFRLEQTMDPGSMLYANVGGVQELDRMSEDF